MGKDITPEVVVLNPLNLVFKKPVKFEGKEYNSVDLSKLEDWTCDDLVNVAKKFDKATGGDISPMTAILRESDLAYCQFVAAEASGMPIEFFKQLPAREAGPLKAMVIGFFHSSN